MLETKIKRILSVILATFLLAAFLVLPSTSATAANSYGLTDNIQGGVILHCWDWSYNTVTSNLQAIANAGYDAVQVSPVEPPKDYNASWTDVSGQWWKLYQPTSLSFADGGSWLGTKSDFTAMCTAAHSYGIKVIVDIVSNHLANNNSSLGNSASNRSSQIPANISSNSAYWHNNNVFVDDNSRYDMTQGSIGEPDLNTGNTDIQQMVLSLMKTCVDCGADGFRFDAAKHIETPSDDTNFASQLWPAVINGIKAYSPRPIYCYGEILATPGPISINAYTEYMSITDANTGNSVLQNVASGNAAGAASIYYQLAPSASKAVLWAESHDTYTSGTNNNSDTQITEAWAIVASRSDATDLFLARPTSLSGGVMGQAGDTTWKDPAVVAVNKLHNAFTGQLEYLSSRGSLVINERGTTGAVIVNISGSSVSANIAIHNLAAGTYKDQVSGGTFTVSGGKLTGSIVANAVVVLNNGTTAAVPGSIKIYFTDNNNWGNVNAYMWKSGANTAPVAWPGTALTTTETNSYGQKIYSVTVDTSKYDMIIFSGSGGQTEDIPLTGIPTGTGFYCLATKDGSGHYNATNYIHG